METRDQGQLESAAPITPAEEPSSRYLYCVALSGEAACLGEIGIGGQRVYTVPHQGLCAVIHDCPPRPYHAEDRDVAEAMVLAHHRVVDAAWRRWGTVLPLAFNTIIRAQEHSAEQNLMAWLGEEYPSLKGKLEALAGKAEYGVQIFWDTALISRKVAETSPEIRKLQEELGSRPRGLAYLYRQRLESLLKKEIESKAKEEFKSLFHRLSCWVDHIHVDKTQRGEGGRQMLMNLSCLVSPERYPDLEAELERVSNSEGYFVRLVGPLPPYSFVAVTG